ncbi:MAG: NRDE family protein [Steroidobacteraceae bacterium]
MCLLVLAWMSHPRYRLVVAANRDEFHERPAAPLGWWGHDTGILAGRDLAAGGTWMGVTRTGRFGAVTNFREFEHLPAPDAPSRGELVPRFLGDEADPRHFVERLHSTSGRYAGFNLLAGGTRSLHFVSNRGDSRPRQLAPGVYGLANHELDAPWPKVVATRARFEAELGRDEPDPAAFFDLLADRVPVAESSGTAGGLPPELVRAMSSPFVVHPRYGTRCSTVLMASHAGRTVMIERRYDSAGHQTGATRVEFAGTAPDE